MAQYAIRPLSAKTWDDFARLVEKHNGVWGGCWCTWFHPHCAEMAAGKRAYKERLVQEGKARAALVYSGDTAVGWCQYGSPAELPHIYHLKQYTAEQSGPPPDYRITCFFVDRDFRGRGVAARALAGAIELIARGGGGVVEAYPHDTGGKRTSGSFLYNGTRAMFERAGFAYDRAKGQKNCVMRLTVHPA